MNNSLLRIGKPKSELNKRQREFNELSENIERLTTIIAELKTSKDEVLARYPTDLNPLIKEYHTFRVELVHVLDRAYDSDLYRNAYLFKIKYLILENAFDLIVQHSFDELKEVFQKYIEIDVETAIQNQLNASRKITNTEFLLEEINTTVSFPENFHEWPEEVQRKFKKERRTHKANLKTNPLQQKASKSVREVYTHLVKEFHPDREQDESQIQRKTEIIQRITQAYQNNDLIGLLKLQIELEQIDTHDLENVSKNQLNYFNKILKQQVEELEQEREMIQKEISQLCHLPYQHINSAVTVIAKFNTLVNEMKEEIKNMRQLIKQWSNPVYLRAFLKTYQIPDVEQQGISMIEE